MVAYFHQVMLDAVTKVNSHSDKALRNGMRMLQQTTVTI